MKITKLHIEGFRSLRKVSWVPGDLNVIIGPNGSGKSNLLRILELISVSAQGKLGRYVQSLGGMNPIVWDGEARSIKFALETKPAGSELDPELYELELLRLGAGSSYKVENERLINAHKQRKGTEKNPFKFLERRANSAVIFDENERTFVTPEEYVADEESLLSIAAGPFSINHFIPSFQRELASIKV
jgi:predicted ATPase